MANLGDVGFTCPANRMFYAYGAFGLNAPNTSVTISATSLVPGSVAILMRNGIDVARTYADASTGVWKFYDVDDSGSQLYTIVTVVQDTGATGEVWTASVVSGVSTVTKKANYIRSNGNVSSG